MENTGDMVSLITMAQLEDQVQCKIYHN